MEEDGLKDGTRGGYDEIREEWKVGNVQEEGKWEKGEIEGLRRRGLALRRGG